MPIPLFQPASQWPTIGEYDVVVVGAGPAGIGAAIAAGQLGVRTLLIEKYGFPGGVAANACCPYLMGFAADGRQIVAGVGDTLVREMDRVGDARLIAHPASVPETRPIGDRPILNNVIISVEGMRVAANRLLQRAGAQTLYYTSLIGAVTDDQRITAIAVDRIDGPGLLRAKTFVDASGDANLVWRAGGEVREAPAEQAMTKTILIRIGGVENFHRPTVEEAFARQVAEEKVPFQAQDRFMGMGLLNPGEVLLNFTLTAGNALRADELTRMDIELREQVPVTIDWFRKEMPGFGNCFLVDTAVGVGVRAGRSIVGHETITMEALNADHPVAEPVAVGTRSYGGHSLNNFEPAWRITQPGTRSIPWRALIPVSFENIVVGGRAISADPRVMDTFRLMARCMATGQAAGVSAALAAQADGSVLAIGYPTVRQALLEQCAIIE